MSWTCPSCGTSAEARFCANCGERQPLAVAPRDGRTVPRPGRAWFGRLHATLRALASPPGRLTADWLRGRRVVYLPPLTFFLWTNVVFFAVQWVSGLAVLSWPLRVHLTQDDFGPLANLLLAAHPPAAGIAQADVGPIFDALESVHAKSLVILMVAPLALVLRALLAARRVSMSDCMTFALHVYTFALIWLCALFPASAVTLRVIALAGGHTIPAAVDDVISALEAVVIAWYVAVALASVWALPRSRSIASSVVLVGAMALLLRPYHFVVFALTLYSI